MLILFPADYYNIKQVDSEYSAEYEAVCQIPDFKTILYNHDGFTSGEPLKIYPKDYYNGDCIYRGWMLTPDQYKILYGYLYQKDILLINVLHHYKACHLFPNIYESIKHYTPKILHYPKGTQIDWDSVNRIFKRFMVKDYVKSVKETNFPVYFETPVDPGEMTERITEFIELRGSLFTGGIVLKEYVDLKKYGEHTNEYRAFFMNHQLLSLSPNSNQSDSCAFVPKNFVMKFANLQSNYYTVDFAELSDGSWTIIETGDGQVSGLSPNQFPFKYYDDIRRILTE